MKEYKSQTGKDIQLLFVQNHGVFISADTPDEIDLILNWVINMLDSAITKRLDFSECMHDKEDIPLISERIRGLSAGISHVIFDSSCESK
ncbi:MAG: hypothetical protein GX800_13540 [Clostridiaceae bacterium]|nr:hypothetical protein [Clostridiaceae bacterium]